MSSLEERQRVVFLLNEASLAGARQKPACAVLGLSARTVQRWQAGITVRGDQRQAKTFTPANKLTDHERAHLLAVANSAEFGDLAPAQIVPRLADRGEYLASESTFYRVLCAHHQMKHRRTERTAHAKPRALCATAPNQLYSWDITYLPTPVRGVFHYLYLFMDVFSRKIVGWQVYAEESSALAGDLVCDICRREKLSPKQVVLHSDNGGPMKGATMLATLQALGVMPSFSRPAVSNDNPYSEALFKTLKYCPVYPAEPFASLSAARIWVARFVHWYNCDHRHSAIGFVTPHERHTGLEVALLKQRRAVYAAAKLRHPQRWSGSTRNWQHVAVVHLNPNRKTPTTLTQEELTLAA